MEFRHLPKSTTLPAPYVIPPFRTLIRSEGGMNKRLQTARHERDGCGCNPNYHGLSPANPWPIPLSIDITISYQYYTNERSFKHRQFFGARDVRRGRRVLYY